MLYGLFVNRKNQYSRYNNLLKTKSTQINSFFLYYQINTRHIDLVQEHTHRNSTRGHKEGTLPVVPSQDIRDNA